MFRLPQLEGDRLYLRDLLASGPLLLTFWASYCAPCEKEFNVLQELRLQMSETPFRVVAVSIDTKGSFDQAVKFADRQKLDATWLWDESGRVQRMYDVTAIPASFVISQDEVILARVDGFPDNPQEFWERLVSDHLAEEPQVTGKAQSP